MSYFSSQFSSSPILTMSPQHAHQSMGMASFGNHTPPRFAPMPSQFAAAQPSSTILPKASPPLLLYQTSFLPFDTTPAVFTPETARLTQSII
ncbi:hypothetical protein FAVG1_12832 [Fusarium avenaceum]|nr:hypothetical protein FAVG1_12832 [Fusarium avenaceum]